MAQIYPLRAFQYNDEQLQSLDKLIAPPYDVISDEGVNALRSSHDSNVTHLTLPEGSDDQKYEMAKTTLENWLRDETLVQRRQEALYLYTQRFQHPERNESILRHGFIALMKLEPFDEGIVLPHERTLSGPREDRLKLMEATGANLEPIFGMYPDPEANSIERIKALMARSEPFISVTDSTNVHHSLWEVTQPELIREFVNDLHDHPVYIVDGHHRYETALNYRYARRDATSLPPEHPVDSLMIFLAPMSDDGLIILPTHRVIHSLPTFSLEKLIEGIAPYFEIEEVAGPKEGFNELDSEESTISFTLMTNERAVLVRLRDGVAPAELVGEDVPDALLYHDVTMLHNFIIERLLNISRSQQEKGEHISYVKNQKDAIAAIEKQETAFVVGMKATTMAQVESVAQSRDVMPQKSTYFYPKLGSGLLFNIYGA